jgi:hypothetical protein
MHHHLSSLIGRERQRELMAQADRQRLARQLSHLARASRPARTSRGRLWLRYRVAR